MTQIERELTQHLQHLTVDIGPRPIGSPANSAAISYIEDTLAEWGFTVDREPCSWPAPAKGGASALTWSIVGRLGLGAPGRVVLCARLDTGNDMTDSDQSAAGLAVLLALGHLLAQHPLRHGLEIVAYNGAAPRLAGSPGCGSYQSALAEQVVASVTFDGPGQAYAPNMVSAHAASPALADGVRRLMGRYPEAVWADEPGGLEHQMFGCDCVPELAVGGAGHAPAVGLLAHSPRRMREAAMLGAEIVALLQHQTPATCRAGDLGVGVGV